MTAACTNTLTFVQTWGYYPSFSLENHFLVNQTGSVGISDRGPVKDTDVQPLRQAGNSIDCDP
jgi:hypothetical protein